MKTRKIKILAGMLFLLTFVPAVLLAAPIEGVVVDTDYARKTFRICPTDESCGVTEENVFVVLPSTKMEGARTLGELNIGDHVSVEGEALNDIVWKAFRVTRLKT